MASHSQTISIYWLYVVERREDGTLDSHPCQKPSQSERPGSRYGTGYIVFYSFRVGIRSCQTPSTARYAVPNPTPRRFEISRQESP